MILKNLNFGAFPLIATSDKVPDSNTSYFRCEWFSPKFFLELKGIFVTKQVKTLSNRKKKEANLTETNFTGVPFFFYNRLSFFLFIFLLKKHL